MRPDRCILLVVGDARPRGELGDGLREADFEVEEADGEGVGGAMRTATYDVVVVDADLVRDAWLQDQPRVPRAMVLALMPASATAAERAALLERGADACLAHPVATVELVATIGSLLRTRDTLVRGLHLQQEIISAIGHDLRSPLSICHLALELLERSDLGDREQGFVTKMKRSYQQILGLSRQLLQLHQTLGNDVHDLRRMPVTLIPIIEPMIEASTRPERGVTLDLAGADPSVQVSGDTVALTSLFSNLLAYGLRRRTGPLIVHVFLEGEMVCIVAGGSTAPSAADVEEVPFRPLEESREVARFDIALFIVARIARAHDGSVSRLCRKDDEAMILVRLPRISS